MCPGPESRLLSQLQPYQHKIGKATDDLCQGCGVESHTCAHLFDCSAFPTNITAADMWYRPRKAAVYISNLPSFVRHLTPVAPFLPGSRRIALPKPGRIPNWLYNQPNHPLTHPFQSPPTNPHFSPTHPPSPVSAHPPTFPMQWPTLTVSTHRPTFSSLHPRMTRLSANESKWRKNQQQRITMEVFCKFSVKRVLILMAFFQD
jgi:hypothetical protein